MQLRRFPSAALIALAAAPVSATPVAAEVLYTIDEDVDALCTIDTATGALSVVGPLGVPFDFGDLAFDVSTGTMYMVDGWGQGPGVPSSLYTVDLATGQATLVGSTGSTSVFGLVHHPVLDKLFASQTEAFPNSFLEIDRASGLATAVGDPGLDLDGLTWVGSTGDVVGLSADPGSLHRVDPATGASTLLFPGDGFVDNCGIAWGPSSNLVYAFDWSGDLYSFHPGQGYARTLLHSFPFRSFDGLAFVDASCVASSYCTAGTTTNGCVPRISAAGAPSAGASSGFLLSVAEVEGQRAGLLFYGTNNAGFVPAPWSATSSSFLCVKSPAQRTPAQFSGGNAGACDGSLAIDWLAFLASHPAALGQPLTIGERFYAQAWFRDPPASKSTNLSDALQWTICP
jgi:hypothetical protein